MATGCMDDVWESEEVWQEWHWVLCVKCVEVDGERQLLGNMLNDTGGEEQAVATRVRAAWIKFRELGKVLCM